MFEPVTQEYNSCELQRYLRRGVADCTIRCLHQSALWAAEQLVGIPATIAAHRSTTCTEFLLS